MKMPHPRTGLGRISYPGPVSTRNPSPHGCTRGSSRCPGLLVLWSGMAWVSCLSDVDGWGWGSRLVVTARIGWVGELGRDHVGQIAGPAEQRGPVLGRQLVD